MDNQSDFRLRFKEAVERNFDRSAPLYDAFEEKHHLFEEITRKLCELAIPLAPARVLDVGCGTGISTVALRRMLPGSPRIHGIDISEAMLVKARARCQGMPEISFLKGDAERLAEYYTRPFDAVFYTASIFLIPDYSKSLDQALRLLRKPGAMLISFYKGFFDAGRQDAMAQVFPDKTYKYGAVTFEELMSFLSSRKDLRTMDVDFYLEVSPEFVEEFLSIPAQSAGLYPKLPYEERVPLVHDLSRALALKVKPLFMGWKFLVSRKI
jgi:ubiquinone/menaquinone biosynthesis C-methylase UbiE